MSKKARNQQRSQKVDVPPIAKNLLDKNTNAGKSLWLWILLGFIIISIGYFFNRGNYVWVVITTIIGIIILTQVNGFFWRKHLFPILAGILLLGSWVAENTERAKWSAEKDHVLTWLQMQESKFVDMGQWQVAIQQYRYPFEKIQGWSDTLRNDRNYATLCRNWLQLYYTFMTVDSHISLDLTLREKEAIQNRSNEKIIQLDDSVDHGKYAFVVNSYHTQLEHSGHLIPNSGNRVLARKEELEKREKESNQIFMWCYFLGSIFLAINYILKEIIQGPSNQSGEK